MTKRALGNTGFDIAPLVLGSNVFGWTADQKTSFRVLDAFVDAGCNLIDTADMYSTWVKGNHGGESETIIGQWLRTSDRRPNVLIATKVGMDMGNGKKGLAKSYILRAVEDSLKRLQTDYIDLYQSHQDDPQTPLEETLSAYQQLLQEGKVRAIGASNYSADRFEESLRISKANNLPAYSTLQPLYNLYDREDFEAQLEVVCEQHEIGVITYFSLASGFLSGKYRSLTDAVDRPRGPMITKYLNDRGLTLLRALDAVASDHQSTPAKVALAWLMARPSVTAPIVSATSVDQLKDLIDATELQLDDQAISTLDNASSWRLENASA